MRGVPHRISHLSAPLRSEPCFRKQGEVRLLVEMTPEHRNAEPALRIVVGRQVTPTEA